MNNEQKVLDNINLVRKIAWEVHKTNRFITTCLDIDDLIQAGTEGLIYAINKYEKQGNNFSTYAYICIKGYILNEIYRLHHLPFNKILKIIKLEKTTKELSKELGRKPTHKEISKKVGKEMEEIEFLQNTVSINIINNDENVFNVSSSCEPIYKEIEKREFFEILSEEAKYVISIVLNSPEEMLNTVWGDTKKKITKYTITKFLRFKGWKFRDIYKVFNEIKLALL